MDDITKRLEEIIQTERAGIDERLQQAGLPPQSRPEAASEPGESGGDQPQTGPPQQDAPTGQQAQSPTGQSQAGEQGQAQQGDGQQADTQSGSGDPERSGLEKMLQNIATQKNEYLDQLPPDPGGRIK